MLGISYLPAAGLFDMTFVKSYLFPKPMAVPELLRGLSLPE